jgi:hypothetical protein
MKSNKTLYVMGNRIKLIKSACLSLFCLLLALAFWFAFNNLFLWREGSVITDLLVAFLLFSVFFIFSMIYLLLVDNRKIVIIASFFIVFSSLIFLLRRNGIWVGIPAIIGYSASTLLLFAAYNMTNRNILNDRKNSIVFHAGSSILKAGPMLLLIFVLLFSVIFYFNFPLLNSEGELEVEEPLIEMASRPFGSIINNFIPVYDFDMSVDEFVVLTTILGLPFTQKEGVELEPLFNMEEPPEEVVNYLKNKGIYNLEEINFTEYLREDEEFKNLLIEEIRRLVTEADPILLYKYRNNLSVNWGIKIGPDERMGQVYTRLINSKINQIPLKFLNLALIFPAVIFFGILQVSFLILNFLYAFLGWAILIIFHKARFYHFKKVQVEKEEIEL